MSLLPLFRWCETSPLAHAIQSSRWAFVAIECLHLLALAALGGLLIMINLRFLGFGIQRQSISYIWRESRWWLIGSVTGMCLSGLLMFLSEAVRLYSIEAFWFKLVSLSMATIFTFTVQRRAALSEPAIPGNLRMRLTGLISLALWSAVGIGGRWIGFS